MGSRRRPPALRRRVALALAVWGVAFMTLAAAAAIPDELRVTLVASPLAPLVGQTVRFNATVHQDHEDSLGRHLSFRFLFGDGSGTDWQTNASATHAYTAPGNYTASVQVGSHNECYGSASVTIHVLALPPPAPDVHPVFAVLDPTRPTVGDAVNLSVVLVNQGTAPATNATVEVTDLRPNGTLGFLGDVPAEEALPPSGTAVVVLGPFRADGVGNHTLRIEVKDVLPPEALPGHGMLNITMPVVAAPPPPARKGPQIRLLAAMLDMNHPVEGESVNLSVLVWNNGTGPLDHATLDAYDVRPNGSTGFLGSVALPAALAPSTGTTIPFPSFVASGAGIHTVRIVAQNVMPPPLESGITEINVTMNVIKASPPPPPDHGTPAFDFGPLALALTGAAIVSVAAAVVLLLKPRPSGSLEPPPAAPPDRSPPPIWPP